MLFTFIHCISSPFPSLSLLSSLVTFSPPKLPSVTSLPFIFPPSILFLQLPCLFFVTCLATVYFPIFCSLLFLLRLFSFFLTSSQLSCSLFHLSLHHPLFVRSHSLTHLLLFPPLLTLLQHTYPYLLPSSLPVYFNMSPFWLSFLPLPSSLPPTPRLPSLESDTRKVMVCYEPLEHLVCHKRWESCPNATLLLSPRAPYLISFSSDCARLSLFLISVNKEQNVHTGSQIGLTVYLKFCIV